MLFTSHAGHSNPALFGTPSPSESPAASKSFTYIIAGGGTAGCVLASRLSEDPNVTVLLIEAGDADTKQMMSRIPAGWANLFKTPADWAFETTEQKGAGRRQMYQPRGKMLGGCSAINALVYQQCSPEDYDNWEAKGAKGWGWKDLQPYFLKSEWYMSTPGEKVEPDNRGTHGHIQTSFPPTNVLTDAFVQAGGSVGVKPVHDFNTPIPEDAIGISRFMCSTANGVRSSTSTAYLPPSVFKSRPNLSILTLTSVTRLLFSSSATPECIGVQVGKTKEGDRWDVFADEVIVAMGAFGSPQLLLASGIGGKEPLEKIGVESVKELDGVGKGLHDHVLSTVVWEATKGSSLQFLSNPTATLPHLAKWLFKGTGALTTNLAEAAAFIRSDDIPGQRSAIAKGLSNASGPTAPDIEIIDAPLYYVHHGMEKAPNPNADYFTLAPVVLRPKSVGSVTIASSSMFDAPLIDPNYLSHELDRKVILEGLKLARRFAQAEPLKSFLVQSVSPKDFETLDDKQLLEHVARTAETIYHPVGTCKIGDLDEGGVVDSDLCVHGVKRLRVCDASVFPDIPSGHPAAAVIAVAERASDLIKGGFAKDDGVMLAANLFKGLVREN